LRTAEAATGSAENLDHILEIENLSVTFDQTEVLSNLTFSVSRAKALAIIGPKGAGKTVLLRALLGSIPHQGSVRWAPGTRLGYVPQKLGLDRDIPMTGEDFLNARLALAADSRARASDMLELLGLSGAVAQQPIAISQADSSSDCSLRSRSSAGPMCCC
jgi:zinc transport system ATP-binding protein